jgi:hypothetical protein
MNMIERVARAICKSRTCEGISCCQWPAQIARRSNCPVDKGNYDDAAHDAIAAMREPTEAMLLFDARMSNLEDSKRIRSLFWQGMIDAALGKEKEE